MASVAASASRYLVRQEEVIERKRCSFDTHRKLGSSSVGLHLYEALVLSRQGFVAAA